MKLSASNIAWNQIDDHSVYEELIGLGFSGIEVAPTRLIPEEPYHSRNIKLAAKIASEIRNTWGLEISSMQSLWFGRSEKLFGTSEERKFLLDYTRASLDFAEAIGCPHVVFGSPKNRILYHPDQINLGQEFFVSCSDYAKERGVIFGIEANPESYGTNFLNTTSEALEMVKLVDSPSLKLNLDIGTVLQNNENVMELSSVIPHASHVHISEPSLAAVQERPEHRQVAKILRSENYDGWISLEMKNLGRKQLSSSLEVVSSIFS